MDHNNQHPNKREIQSDAVSKIVRFFSIILAISIIVFCYAFARLDSGILRIVLFVLSALFGCLSLFVIAVMLIGSSLEGNGKNFFLYDAKRKSNISPEELTIASIREKLMRYMSTFKVRGKLYIGDLFDDKFHVPEYFKPLFCYELLCQIADSSSDAELFLSFGLECAEIFSKYLNENKDYDLALDIKLFIIDFSVGKRKGEDFKRYITAKKTHIEEMMLNYTKENIEKFI